MRAKWGYKRLFGKTKFACSPYFFEKERKGETERYI
nr:MAG TPA: hypothetical protein [Caudoviricetes sp.]